MKPNILLPIFAFFCCSPNLLNGDRIQNKKYVIEIRISACVLRLYEVNDDSRILIRKYPVATAKRGLKPVPLGKGKVTKIEFNPWWHPTAYSREFFAQKKHINLPKAVPPGDALNFLGKVSIHLSHTTYKGAIYRIHGNNDESLVGKRVTGGCIRLHNKDAEELARLISVGTEVDILP